MQRALKLAIAGLFLARAAGATPPTLDGLGTGGVFNGHAAVTSSSTGSVSITTGQSPDIIVLFAAAEVNAGGTPPTVSTVEGCDPSGSGCSGALTWKRRSQNSFTGGSCFLGNPCSEGGEVWWANSPGTLSSHSVAIVFNKSIDHGSLQIVGVHGAGSITSPWDSNVGLPNYKTTTSPAKIVSNSFSTSNIDDVLFAFFSFGNYIVTGDAMCGSWSNSAFNDAQIDSQNVGYLRSSGLQTGQTVSENGSNVGAPCDGTSSASNSPWRVSVDAITATAAAAATAKVQFQTPW